MAAVEEPSIEVGQTWEHVKSGRRVEFRADSPMGPDYIVGVWLDTGEQRTFHRPTVRWNYRGIEQT